MIEQPEYDFVILGAGTAELVIANRLSVLVLEAGSNRIKESRTIVPGLSSALYDDPELDWMFRSVPHVGISALSNLKSS